MAEIFLHGFNVIAAFDTKRQAENCYRAVIGKIDAYDYNTNVTSALLELFSILK